MNILSNALKRLKGKSKPDVVKLPQNDSIDRADRSVVRNSEDQAERARNLETPDPANLDPNVVDIPLNQEVADTAESDLLAKINLDDELDFDLGETWSETTGTPGNVLDINPARSFSYPVDLNLDSLQEQGFLTPNNANTQLSNNFRMIKRPLLNNVGGKAAVHLDRANLIMVTSSLSAEGKSYSAINLAISIAMEKNHRVLLIDADVNKPSHHNIFGVETEHGLTDYLSGKVNDMSRIMFRTNIESLSLMFSGSLTSHTTELLASQAMEDFLEELSNRYPDRIIIFDSPPLLQTTEASVLAQYMGQVVLVVEAEKTYRHQVQRSAGLLTNEVVLILLNKMREKGDAGHYGYYGYGHQG